MKAGTVNTLERRIWRSQTRMEEMDFRLYC